MSATEDHRPHSPSSPTGVPLHRSTSHPKPKGILKNAPHSQNSQSHSLQWDEENLALTEIQKDSLMKITEPKTPYVRYNAETDEIEGEIPEFHLGNKYITESPPLSPVSSTGADTSGPSSRRTSISSSGGGRPSSAAGRSASTSSSRSTSFSLPRDSAREMRSGGENTGLGEEVEEGEEMDPEAAEKHAAFLRARGRHYSGEAEAMKRAKQLLNGEEDEDDKMPVGGDREDEEEEVEGPIRDSDESKVNGI